MKKTRWIIIALFFIILICVFAVILPQQTQKENAARTQAALTAEVEMNLMLTQFALTPTLAEIPFTDLGQACGAPAGQAVQIRGEIKLGPMFFNTDNVFVSGLNLVQGDSEASLKNVPVCQPSGDQNCIYFPGEQYTQADLRGVDAAGIEFGAGDAVTVIGRVQYFEENCQLVVQKMITGEEE